MRKVGTRRIGRLALAAIVSAWLGASSASAAPNTGMISLSGGVDFTTAYFFRGILQERNGLIVQPYLELGLALYKGEGDFSNFSLIGGTWNSIHSEGTNHTNTSLDVLYEQDWYLGTQFGFLDNKLITRAFWLSLLSPSGAFTSVQEIDLSAALDDSAWLGAFALKPTLLIAFEIDNTSFGTENGTYLEFGVAPALPSFNITDDYPVTVSFPNKVGLSLEDYYEVPTTPGKTSNNTFGYYSGGIKVSIPLAFIPEDYGAWAASGGVQFMLLGDHTGDLNGEDFWTVGTWGISMAY